MIDKVDLLSRVDTLREFNKEIRGVANMIDKVD